MSYFICSIFTVWKLNASLVMKIETQYKYKSETVIRIFLVVVFFFKYGFKSIVDGLLNAFNVLLSICSAIQDCVYHVRVSSGPIFSNPGTHAGF